MALFTSCVSEYYAPPIEAECINPNLTATKTITDIYAIAINPAGTPANSPVYGAIPSQGDDILEGYVISSDEGGNFYQSIYIQPLDKSKGFNISVDIKTAYLKKLQPGKKIYLKIKGLAFANPTSFANGLIFGQKPTDKFAVDRLDNFERFIIPSCDVISEDLLVNKITIAQAIAPNNSYLNTLVEIDNAQFDDATSGGTYDFNLTNDFDDNTYVVDASSPSKLAVRTSKFANFKGYNTPKNSGKIRGVLTKYNSGYQIVLRTEKDVKMENTRLTFVNFPSTVNEPFTSYSLNETSFLKYINDKIIGTRLWAVKQFPTGTGNKYIEMSSYTGPTTLGSPSTSYFMVPVDFTAASTFTFSKETRNNAGVCLNIYYLKSTDFTPGALDTALFTNITSSFNITYPALGSSENVFSNAGTYNIPPSLTGNGYFIFEYVGTTTVTTRMQIDDIVIN